MFRVTNTFKNLNITQEIFNTNSYVVSSQTVRWRKPRWVPIAKSKMFKVPPRTIIPEDEKIELKKLNDNYKTQIKSIRRYLNQKYYSFHSLEADPEEQKREFEADFARCMELNNKWNEEQKALREKRTAEVLEANLDFARKRIEAELIKEEEKLELIEEIVRKEKEEEKNYITPENIDAAIERALASTVDYNFAINLNGEKITEYEHEKKIEKVANAS